MRGSEAGTEGEWLAGHKGSGQAMFSSKLVRRQKRAIHLRTSCSNTTPSEFYLRTMFPVTSCKRLELIEVAGFFAGLTWIRKFFISNSASPWCARQH